MDKFIQSLISGYENPALITDASDKKILYANRAARRVLGIDPDSNKCLEELFTPHRVVRNSVIWERKNQYYRIHEEKLNLNDHTYIKTTFSPVGIDQNFDFFELQREMARLLVHRFHSPLNGISGYAELLSEQPLDDKQREYLSEMESGLDDFRKILADLNSLAQDLTVQISEINVRDFIDSITRELAPEQRERVNVIIANGHQTLESDYVLLQGIVEELLENALEHSGDPDGPVSVSFDEETIRVTSFGAPIPENYIHKMFYPFFSNKARGVGLGLPKCVAYAREMGYSVLLADNSAAEGITFEVRMRGH